MTDVSSFYRHILNPGGGLYSPQAPPNQVMVPPLPVFGNGTQLGYAPQASHRLLPNPGLPSVARDGFPAVAAIEQAAPAMASAIPSIFPVAQASTPRATPARPVAKVTGQMRNSNPLLDLLTGQKPSGMGMLLAALGGSSSRSPSAPGSYFSVATGGDSSEGGIEGNGGITGYY